MLGGVVNSYEAATLSGWISIACWIIVYQPQIWTCYKLKSGEGLSIGFIMIWLAGDLANLLGAIWQGLLPTMIILALYYTLCDIILLFQIYYYRFLRRRYPHLFSQTDPTVTEETTLLSGKPHQSKRFYQSELFQKALEYFVAVGFVAVVGVSAWKINQGDGTEVPEVEEKWDLKAQVFGWISAFLYLGSRLPQIAKNKETKCEGLSLMMFGFSIAGNLTYVLSIVLQSVSLHHLWVNLSWVIGSGGTIGLDLIVLAQFFWYRQERRGVASILKGEEREEV